MARVCQLSTRLYMTGFDGVNIDWCVLGIPVRHSSRLRGDGLDNRMYFA
ncbi:hypothetical protein G5T19_10335 [Lactobacillus reuteri]|nr:hypothetical protein [Limosilactobacillus reuteri]